MRKKLFLISFCLLIIATINVYASSFDITDVRIKEKTDTIVVQTPSILGKEITTGITFNKINDYVTFSLSLKNNEDVKYRIKRIYDNNTISNVELTYLYDEDYIQSGETTVVEIKVLYKEELINTSSINLDNLTIDIEIVDEEGNILSPRTGDMVIYYVIIFIMTLMGIFLVLKANKKAAVAVWLIALVLIPVLSYASADSSIRIVIKNLVINATKQMNNYVSYNQELHVDGRNLVNKYGEIVRLRGMAIDNSKSLREDWYNIETFTSLKSWGVNVIRVPMSTYTEGDNLTYPEHPELIENFYHIVDACIELDLYVIADWHVLAEKDPLLYKEYAKDFFDKVIDHYGDIPNIIYEIANEPYSSWDDMVAYSNEMIPYIREKLPNSVILVGGDFAGKTADLDYANIMFVPHIYGFTGDGVNRIISYIQDEVPIFVTEFGVTTSVDWARANPESAAIMMPEYADRLIRFMEKYDISWTNWSISCNPGYPLVQKSKWNNELRDDTLNPSGVYIKSIFKKTRDLSYLDNISEMMPPKEGVAFWNDDYRTLITKVIFENTIDQEKIANSYMSWDVTSITSNKKVYAYLVDDPNEEGKYYLYIAGDGMVYIEFSCKNLFGGMTNLKEVDLTYFNTDGVNDMSYMFDRCYALKNIIFGEHFNTSNVSTMYFMFKDCSSLQNTDFSFFDTSVLRNFRGMFQRASLNGDINLSSFTTENIINIGIMFDGISGIKRLDISGMDFADAALLQDGADKMINNVRNGMGYFTIIVKNQNAKTYIEGILTANNVHNAEVFIKGAEVVVPSFAEAFNSGEYDWSDLHNVAKYIASQFGLESGKINKLTSRAVFNYDNKEFALEIGDVLNLKDTYNNTYKVRILGFNTDKQADVSKLDSEYTYDSEYAGISFEFINQLWYEKNPEDFWSIKEMNGNENTNAGGWGATTLRTFINSDSVLEKLENNAYIKTIKKEYNLGNMQTANAENPAEDKLWLIAGSEIYPKKNVTVDENTISVWGYSLTIESTMTEGIDETRYAFYVLVSPSYGKSNEYLKRPKTNEVNPSRGWWLRSPIYNTENKFGYVSSSNPWVGSGGASATSSNGIAPCFSI